MDVLLGLSKCNRYKVVGHLQGFSVQGPLYEYVETYIIILLCVMNATLMNAEHECSYPARAYQVNNLWRQNRPQSTAHLSSANTTISKHSDRILKTRAHLRVQGWCPFDLYFDYDNVTETFYRYIGDYATQTCVCSPDARGIDFGREDLSTVCAAQHGGFSDQRKGYKDQ